MLLMLGLGEAQGYCGESAFSNDGNQAIVGETGLRLNCSKDEMTLDTGCALAHSHRASIHGNNLMLEESILRSWTLFSTQYQSLMY